MDPLPPNEPGQLQFSLTASPRQSDWATIDPPPVELPQRIYPALGRQGRPFPR